MLNRGEEDQYRVFSRRAAILVGGKAVLFSTLIGRMYYLQVIEGDHPSTFIGHSRLRKAGQLNWPVEG